MAGQETELLMYTNGDECLRLLAVQAILELISDGHIQQHQQLMGSRAPIVACALYLSRFVRLPSYHL